MRSRKLMLAAMMDVMMMMSTGWASILGQVLSAQNECMATYTYDNEAVLDIKIKRTEVYPDKLVITFADGSLSKVESIVCYGTDFSVIEENPQFSFSGNKLTIETQNADMISGLHIEENSNIYFKVRYLDSDSYAMLVYSWADDFGYMTGGDEDTYYTQEEKDEQEADALALAEAENAAYNKLLGTWVNESETVRIEFSYGEDGFDKEFTVYEFADDEWVERENVFITGVSEDEAYESMEITLYDNPYYGCAYYFYLCNDNTGMECRYSDEKFVKAEKSFEE